MYRLHHFSKGQAQTFVDIELELAVLCSHSLKQTSEDKWIKQVKSKAF